MIGTRYGHDREGLSAPLKVRPGWASPWSASALAAPSPSPLQGHNQSPTTLGRVFCLLTSLQSLPSPDNILASSLLLRPSPIFRLSNRDTASLATINAAAMSNMSDEELDRNWTPNGRRPQSYVSRPWILTAPPIQLYELPHWQQLTRFNYSTMARSFSAELMDIFRIENSVSDLDSQVDKRSVRLPSATRDQRPSPIPPYRV